MNERKYTSMVNVFDTFTQTLPFSGNALAHQNVTSARLSQHGRILGWVKIAPVPREIRKTLTKLNGNDRSKAQHCFIIPLFIVDLVQITHLLFYPLRDLCCFTHHSNNKSMNSF